MGLGLRFEVLGLRLKLSCNPLLPEEGWLRNQENAAKQPLKAQTGWSVNLSGPSATLLEWFPGQTAHSRAASYSRTVRSSAPTSRGTSFFRPHTPPGARRSAAPHQVRRLRYIPDNKNRQCTDLCCIAGEISSPESGGAEDVSIARLRRQCLDYAAPYVWPSSLACCKCCEVGYPCGSLLSSGGSILTTPSARSKVASRYLSDGAATPPLGGGDYNSISTSTSSSEQILFS